MVDQSDVVVWAGELLWPCALKYGPVIDASAVTAVGVWLYPWFRSHPRTAIVGASERLRQQMQDAELPVLWYKTHADRGPSRGVTASERAGLWGDE